MTKSLVIEDIIAPDKLGTEIARFFQSWESLRSPKKAEWLEVSQYVYATDTTKTSNAQLPWSNKTTIPKLCQIRDNLHANYKASMFPKRKWLTWQADTEKDDEQDKRKSIENYISWCIDRNDFYDEVDKLILDYIDYGNSFATVEWVDGRSVTDDKQQVGYVGPMIRRISPLDIVFNPAAPSFTSSPKIIRSLISIGEVKEMIERGSLEEGERAEASDLYNYMVELRSSASQHRGDLVSKENIYAISGFGNYSNYLASNTVELLTFYGDIYNEETGTFERNQIIKVVDRHKVLSHRDNPSYFGSAPIFHSGWRVRPDNLWAMGPLDNLVGMQYRIDHLENMKADIWDLTRFPVFKIRGFVEDFDWAPGEHIIVGDNGDVELISPDSQVLQANTEIAILEAKMEEMSGSPKEAMGFRSPGEKTKYEVQRLENAASRIYQNKISQFERGQVEPLLNAMLELARRHLDRASIRVFDTDTKINEFIELSALDITGNGRLKPIAARHFAEQAEMLQNLSGFFSSAIGSDPDVKAHFSSVKLARLLEEILNLEDYNIVEPYIRLTEQQEALRMSAAGQEQTEQSIMTPAGISPEDYDQVI